MAAAAAVAVAMVAAAGPSVSSSEKFAVRALMCLGYRQRVPSYVWKTSHVAVGPRFVFLPP